MMLSAVAPDADRGVPRGGGWAASRCRPAADLRPHALRARQCRPIQTDLDEQRAMSP